MVCFQENNEVLDENGDVVDGVEGLLSDEESGQQICGLRISNFSETANFEKFGWWSCQMTDGRLDHIAFFVQNPSRSL